MAFIQRRSPRFNNVLANGVPDTGTQALTGAAALSDWTVAALALVAGAVALSGTSPSATWTSASIELGKSPLALVGTSPSTTWTVPTLALAPQPLALSGTIPAATWNAAAIELTPGSVALSGTTPLATWSVAAIDLVQGGGSQALSGTSPAATWTPAAIDLALSPFALVGTSPSATWSVPAIELFQGGILTGVSPASTWTVPALDLAAGSVALSGTSAAASWAVGASILAEPSADVPRDAVAGPLLPRRPRLRPQPQEPLPPLAQRLRGAPASSAWTVAPVTLWASPVPLQVKAFASARRVWTVSTLAVVPSPRALSGLSPSMRCAAVGIVGATLRSGPPPIEDGSTAKSVALRAILEDDDELVQLGVL